ncbi:MAG: hypothetical protein K8R59_10680 [Thermoanaerobaculales bacterium]|nr:hypothetical protein [Thermoanaerobaculales bacterium]
MKLHKTPNGQRTAGIALAVVMILGAPCGSAQAQDNEPWNMHAVEGVVNVIPVQGRLATSTGAPLNGLYNVTFRFYDALNGGDLLCDDQDTLTIDNGLFNAEVNWCTSSDISGQALYLSIEVGTDGEMDPRLAVYPVPYAFTLRPGAQILDTRSNDALLHIENDAESGRALRAYAMAETSTNYGVVGASRSPDGFGGYFYNTGGGVGLKAESNGDFGTYAGHFYNSGDGVGLFVESDGPNADAIQAESATNDGVQGKSGALNGRGLYGYNTGGGSAIGGYSNSSSRPTLRLTQMDPDGDFVIGGNMMEDFWRVDRTGKGFFNGGTQTGGADFAERVDVVGDESSYEPGDVLVISQTVDRAVELAAKPFSTAVMGIYSTEPGVLAGAPDSDLDLGGIPVAITGIVPCKVSNENGSIKRGDLLVTSSRTGHAMRAGANPPAGTVVGKALQPLEKKLGVIEIFVCAR